MKWKLCLILLLSGLPSFAQQSEIKGIVSIFNSKTNTGKRQYVVNAQVLDDFGKAQPALTDYNGQFTLIYVGVNEKSTVSFHIKAPGLSVVNTEALTAITGQFDLKHISMANPDSIDSYKRIIYNIGKSEAEKYLEKQERVKNAELAQLRTRNDQNRNKIEQLKKELSDLVDKKSKIEQQAQDLAKTYAVVNLDDASPLFRKAFLLFQKGDIDSAVFVLNKTNTPSSVDSIRLEETQINGAKLSLVKRDSILKQRKKDKGEALLLEADLHKTRYEFEKAKANYDLLVKLDSLNTNYIFTYAYFLDWLNQFEKAIYYYNSILKLCKTNPNVVLIAKTQNNLGAIYYLKNDFTRAELAYQETLKIYAHLAMDNPEIYEPSVARVQNNLGIVYEKQNYFIQAASAYNKAQVIYKRLSRSNPKTYWPDLAGTQNNLGILYTDQGSFEKADSAYQEALEIYKQLTSNVSKIYEAKVATTQNNLGNLYNKNKDFIGSSVRYQKALEIYQRLSKNNPETYEPYIAHIQNNLGVLYSNNKDFIKAEVAYRAALQIYEQLAKNAPDVYDPYVAMMHYNLGALFQQQRDFVKAKAAYYETLEIYKHLFRNNTKYYGPLIATTQSVIGDLYYLQQDFEKAGVIYSEAIEIYKNLAKNDPKSYNAPLATLCNRLGNLYLNRNDYTLAEKYFTELLIIEEGVHEDPLYTYEFTGIRTAGDLIEVYFEILDAYKYDAFKKGNADHFESVEKILAAQSEKAPFIANKLAMYYNLRSWYLLFASKFREAQQAAEKGLAIDSSLVVIKTTLAHSLLLQGRYDDAVTIYKELKKLKHSSRRSVVDVWMENFAELEANGIKSKNIDRIRAFLKKTNQESN